MSTEPTMNDQVPKIFVDAAIFRYATSVKVSQYARLSRGKIRTKEGLEREADFLVYESRIETPPTPNNKLKVDKRLTKSQPVYGAKALADFINSLFKFVGRIQFKAEPFVFHLMPEQFNPVQFRL
jgi:hypothetical protein